MPCQSASKRLCGLSRLAMPDKDLQGSSFKNGVRFSVQTFSEGSVPCRNLCGEPHSGNEPSGRNVITGDVVRCSSSEPRDAQNRPLRAFLNPFHRSSTLRPKTRLCSNFSRCPGSRSPDRCTISHPGPKLGSCPYTAFFRIAPIIIIPFSSI